MIVYYMCILYVCCPSIFFVIAHMNMHSAIITNIIY